MIHAKFGYIEQIDTKFKVKVNDIYLTDDCNMFVTDDENNSIARLFPSGSVSTVFSTVPIKP